MFSYKSAVAVKTLGFKNVKIYNGGIKDWRKNGYPLESQKPLPEQAFPLITSDELYGLLQKFESSQCQSPEKKPLLTLLDFRNVNLDTSRNAQKIATVCPTRSYRMDDILKPEVREALPKHGKVVLLTETGNRDEFVVRYLSQHGVAPYTSLQHGMRGWLKKRYPTTK